MAGSDPKPISTLRCALLQGMAIPAHPLALTESRKFDERRQAALTRYYCDAGAGGIAVAVHTTQFAIRDSGVDLLEPVLRLAAETVNDWSRDRERPITVAGVCGPTPQALAEAQLARSLGYDAALLSLAALRTARNAAMLEHCRRVGEIIPIVGFYLQPAVGGRILDRAFWREFLDIEQVVAIKVAPFDRYRTLDVVTALIESGRTDVALYTGNDDAIVTDLLTPFPAGDNRPALRFRGGLLGQWAVWTRNAVSLLKKCRGIEYDAAHPHGSDALQLLATGTELTDANAAFFDAANQFAGCIPGIHEVLRRQGLLAGRWCLDPREELSPGQMDAIERVLTRYPHLADDDFVKENVDRWLR
jgi:dihydrodipicolinate synthase/N-acetylneuraminate lyase